MDEEWDGSWWDLLIQHATPKWTSVLFNKGRLHHLRIMFKPLEDG